MFPFASHFPTVGDGHKLASLSEASQPYRVHTVSFADTPRSPQTAMTHSFTNAKVQHACLENPGEEEPEHRTLTQVPLMKHTVASV